MGEGGDILLSRTCLRWQGYACTYQTQRKAKIAVYGTKVRIVVEVSSLVMKRTPNSVSLCFTLSRFSLLLHPPISGLSPNQRYALAPSPLLRASSRLSLPLSRGKAWLREARGSSPGLSLSRSARPLVLITAPQSTPLSCQYRSEEVSQERARPSLCAVQAAADCRKIPVPPGEGEAPGWLIAEGAPVLSVVANPARSNIKGNGCFEGVFIKFHPVRRGYEARAYERPLLRAGRVTPTTRSTTTSSRVRFSIGRVSRLHDSTAPSLACGINGRKIENVNRTANRGCT